MKPKGTTVSIYLDARRPKSAGKYPVKLRVYHDYRTHFYSTGITLSKEAFEDSYLNARPKKEHREVRDKLLSIETRAKDVIDSLTIFTPADFERAFYRQRTGKGDVVDHYNAYIKDLRSQDRVSTAISYECSRNSIQSFTKAKAISFLEITPDFLRRYEKWMLTQGNSLTTVGIYLRPLRSLFNIARERGDISIEVYPFGKRKYQIPAGRNIKKALDKDALRKLFQSNPESPYQAKAKDFWFFSYQCNGINFKDIADLKYSNLHDDSIIFTRHKTRLTTKADSKPIIAARTDYINSIISKYGNKKLNGNTYVFPIYNDTMNAEQRKSATVNFIKFVNQHLKNLAESLGLSRDISTYWARHSYTTNAIRNGATMEYISESLGHKSLSTTQNYFKGFEDEARKEIADKLLEF